MIKVLIAPHRYVQGVGVLPDIGKYITPLGRKALVIWGPVVSQMFSGPVAESFKNYEIEWTGFQFNGECDRTQERLGIERAKAFGAEVVIGIGGGKAIDLAKAVAAKTKAKMVSVPTIASNDAPTSSATVYYTEDGIMDGWEVWVANPNLVLVDTQVIVNAPARWLASGIADGLTTWFEAEAAFKGRRTAIAGGVATMTAMMIARLCYDVLMEFGVQALMDCEKHVVTPAVEKVVEANTLLSGLGFESGGVCTSHAIANGLTMLKATQPYSHGEKVSFGLVSELCLDEDIRNEERIKVVDFLIACGLPVTFEELGIGNLSNEEIMGLAEKFAGPGQITHNHVFTVTPFDVYSAMISADTLGRVRKAALKK